LTTQLRDITGSKALPIWLDMNCGYDSHMCDGGEPCIVEFTHPITGNTTIRSIAEHAIDILDGGVTLMAYYDNIESVLDRSAAEVTWVKEKDTAMEVVVAFNLKYSEEVPAASTLYDQGLETLEFFINETQIALEPSRFAIHHYGYFNMLSPPENVTEAYTRDFYWWCSTSTTGVDACNIYDADHRAQLITFMHAYGGHTVYIDAPAIVALEPPTGDQQILVDFIEELNDHGFKSQLIFGSHEWSLTEHHHIPLSYATNALRMLNYYGTTVNVTAGDACSCE
jgi:hypothetical protein